MSLLTRILPVGPLAGLLMALILISACNPWPADPRNALAAAQERGTLRVGVAANPPWVELHDLRSPAGMESELIREFAAQQGLEVEWHAAGIEQQIEALKKVELDLLIGGFSAANPWKAEVGQTFVYFREQGQNGSLGRHVILTAPGENALLMALERHLFQRLDPEHYLPRLRETSQP
jgi:ABC-type amino acid transport substrate-binding protein